MKGVCRQMALGSTLPSEADSRVTQDSHSASA